MFLLKQYSTATSGTITGNTTKQDSWIIHNGASLAVTLTIAFPSSPVDGQRFGVTSTLGVTTLTLSSAITLVGSIATLAAGGFAEWMYDINSDKWYRIG